MLSWAQGESTAVSLWRAPSINLLKLSIRAGGVDLLYWTATGGGFSETTHLELLGRFLGCARCPEGSLGLAWSSLCSPVSVCSPHITHWKLPSSLNAGSIWSKPSPRRASRSPERKCHFKGRTEAEASEGEGVWSTAKPAAPSAASQGPSASTQADRARDLRLAFGRVHPILLLHLRVKRTLRLRPEGNTGGGRKLLWGGRSLAVPPCAPCQLLSLSGVFHSSGRWYVMLPRTPNLSPLELTGDVAWSTHKLVVHA